MGEGRFGYWRECATWVEQYQTIRANKVYPASTCLATQQEYELLALRVIELVNKLLALGDSHRAIQAEVPVPMKATFDVIAVESHGCRRTFYFEAFSRRYLMFAYNY